MRRAVIVSVAICAASVVVFLANLRGPTGPTWLPWAPIAGLGLLAGWVHRRASRLPSSSQTARLFWSRVTPLPVLIGCSQAGHGLGWFGDHVAPVTYASWPLLTTNVVVIGIFLNAVIRLPHGRRAPRPETRTVLDAFTVVLSASLIVWHFSARTDVEFAKGASPATALAVVLAVVVIGFILLGVFVLLRRLFIGAGDTGVAGLRWLAAEATLAALAGVSQPVITRVDPGLPINALTMPVMLTLSTIAASRQWRSPTTDTTHVASRRGDRSVGLGLLPYVSIAIVDALLVWSAMTHDDVEVVALAAVLITAVVVVRQVVALRDNARLLKRLEFGATHDALTGLANRVLVHRRLGEALSGPVATPVAVLLIDLDDFKEVNDTLGHEVGDQLLIEVGGRLTRCVRRGDTVARLGGDEFVLVLTGCSRRTADVVAGRVVRLLRRAVRIDGHELLVRASIGIADGAEGDDPSLLLRRADIAMYAAKLLPGSAFLHYREDMSGRRSDLTTLAATLREGIERGELTLLYQPVVALGDGRIVGAEALVRWQHPSRGLLSPDAFVPLAERSGLSPMLARWVMDAAFAQLSVWSRRPSVPLTQVSVNLSAADLGEASLAAELRGLLDRHSVLPQQVTVEITESSVLEGADALACLRQVRDLGVRVSLDDFGTGYSTLSVLRDCPVDEIKLDRTFTQKDDVAGRALAATVQRLAREFGLHAVAEGVETPEQARRLAELGYETAQGFHFGRPMTAQALTAILDAGGHLPLHAAGGARAGEQPADVVQ